MASGLIRVGVLGASRIVKKALCDVSAPEGRVVAIAARDESRAAAFASEHGIARSYGSYRQLVEDPEIDVVYVALPASAHAEWAQAALRAGKAVLCEKPFSLSSDQARTTVAVAEETGKLLMEAHHWRYHPLVSRGALALKQIGSPTRITAEFKVGLNRPTDIRRNPLLGPGVMMDFGCYLIKWAVWAARCVAPGDWIPQVSTSRMVEDPALLGVDMAAEVELCLGPVQARLCADMRDNLPFSAYVRVDGTEGSVLFENPLAVEGARLITILKSQSEPQIELPVQTTTYRQQWKAFCHALATGSPPPTSGYDIIETQQLLDESYLRAGLCTRAELREKTLAAG